MKRIRNIIILSYFSFSILTYYTTNGTVCSAKSLDLDNTLSTSYNFNLNSESEDVLNTDSKWIQLIVLCSNNNNAGAYTLINDINLGITTDPEKFDKIHSEYFLTQNYTNLFNSATIINYSISDMTASSAWYQNTSLVIYDLLRKEVKI